LESGPLAQCLAERISPMAWGPLAAGQLGDGAKRLLPSQQQYRPQSIVPVLDAIAKVHGSTRTVIALAWLLKVPSGIVPIVGSTDPARIREATTADEVELSRDAWYRLFVAARGSPLP